MTVHETACAILKMTKARNIFLNTTLPSDYFLSNVLLGLKYVYSNLLQWTWLTFAWIYLLDLLTDSVFQS